MADEEIFLLVPDPVAAAALAERAFEALKMALVPILPASVSVRHIGATAIPGCLTKGDLDIVVRVDAADFAQAEAALAARFQRNTGSIRTDAFAAFEDAARTPPLGIQLAVKGDPLDDFHDFADALNDDPVLVERYNALKRVFNGRPMTDYRAAKDAFIAEVLAARRDR